MTNYIKKLKELRAKATPGPWQMRIAHEYSSGVGHRSGAAPRYLNYISGDVLNEKEIKDLQFVDSDAQLIAEMRNSLDLWLELAEELQVLLAMDYTKDVSHFDNVRASFAKLRGEAE